jgi:ABC-2 type transport system ATP-binding protein
VAELPVVETVALRKRYGAVEALRGLDLTVPRGSICGVLGRNGAGKTTTLKILLGLVRPTAGQARVLGLAADSPPASLEIRRRTGFVSQDKDLYDAMTVAQILRFTARFFPQWRSDLAERYLRRLDLPPTRKVRALSHGMRNRLALLLALCRSAELLVLDEPTSSLDPAGAEEVLQTLVGHVASEGTTVLLCTQQIAEVEQIADRVVILDRGRTVAAGALDELQASYRRVRLVFAEEAPSVQLAATGAQRVQRDGRVLSVLTRGGADPVLAEAQSLQASSIEVLPVTLKEIFLESVIAEE